MGNPDWAQRLTYSLTRKVGDKTANEIMEGCEWLDELDEKSRAAWVTLTMDKLDAAVTGEDARIEMMTSCSCRCYTEVIDEIKKEYQANKDIDRLLDVMYGKVFLVKPVRDGNVIYITKAPRFPGGHARAKTPEEKRYYFCHCDYARAVAGPVSKTFCLCGAGWCKRIWEAVLERPVRVDLVRSVLQGDDVCQFAVYV